MGLIICKIWSKFVSPWITCHHALKSTISKLSAEWTGLIIITHCFMKIKTVIQRKFLAPPEEQFGVPVSILLSRVVADSEPIKYYHRESDSEPMKYYHSESDSEPMKYYHSESGSPRGRYRGPPINRVLYCQDNSGVGLEGKNLVTAVRQSQNLAGFIGIKQLTITSCLLKKYLAARKRAKQKGTYEIKPTDSQGDQVDAGAAAAFVKFEDNKMAAALLFRSENAWVQLCYQNNELRIESLERPRDFKKDHLFILCPLEQNRYKLQCAFHQESYVIVKEKGAGHCVSLGNSEDESIFELRTEDDNLF